MNAPHGQEAEPVAPSGADPRPCGCTARKNALNTAIPGLGDVVATVAEPVYERWNTMPAMLKPDMKSLVWLLIGAFVVPRMLTMVR